MTDAFAVCIEAKQQCNIAPPSFPMIYKHMTPLAVAILFLQGKQRF